jgi:hypothetical protein
MPSMQTRYQAGPVETRVDTLRIRAASKDANLPQICARFASLWMARALCVTPLEVVPDAFSVTAATVCVAPLPFEKQ